MNPGLAITGAAGICGGAVVAAALSAFIIGLGIIPRYAGITHTGRHILLYEDFLVAGCITGNLISVYRLQISAGNIGAGLTGLFFGIFLGSWIIALGEVQKEQEKAKKYEEYVKKKTPVHSLAKNMLGAFISGGLICTLGQGILNMCQQLGLDKETAGSWTSLILVFLSVLFTGLNIYPKLAKWGGAGTLVPITGFANSVAAPAIEYQKEGQVFGIGCKIFTIAGPVILYGILVSSLLGLIYYFLHMWGIV